MACQIFFIVAACEFLVVRCKLFIVACEIQFPNQESNPGRLYWEHGMLATGPLRKFYDSILKEQLFYQNGIFLELAFFFFFGLRIFLNQFLNVKTCSSTTFFLLLINFLPIDS